jgi:D-sedoheptulose 7-phosphate isomerase
MKHDNKARKLGDINFYVPANTYGIVECIHQIMLHSWLDEMMHVKEW